MDRFDDSSQTLLKTAIAIFFAAVAIGVVFALSLPLENIDHEHFLKVWIDALDRSGLAGTLGDRIANYTAPYIVLLAAVNALLPDASTLTIMHTTGLVLHVGLAGVLVVAAKASGSGQTYAVLIIMAALMPTSLVNGLVWGQSDAFFASFTLLALVASIYRYWIPAFVLFSISLSIKLVAVFAAPAFLIFIVRAGAAKKIAWFPVIFLLTYLCLNMPYILQGIPVADVLLIYADQAATFDQLAMNSPNIWYVLSLHPSTAQFVQEFKSTLISFSASISVLAVVALCTFGLRGRKPKLNAVDHVWLLAISALVLPSLLTKMHDRYFFLADVTMWLLAMVDRRYIVPAVLVQLGSLAAYTGFLEFTHSFLPLPPHYIISVGALFMIAGTLAVGYVGYHGGTWHRVFGRESHDT